MDKDEKLRFEGRWDQIRGRVKESWGSITDDDLDRSEGRWEQLVGVIKERTGESVDQIESRLKRMAD